MEPAKYFNNVIIGQFVLTGVPVKVYIGGRYLTITDADDVEDPIFGFGMDEDGDMQRFDYRNVMQLSVSGNIVDLETYNKGMEAKFGGGEEKAESRNASGPRYPGFFEFYIKRFPQTQTDHKNGFRGSKLVRGAPTLMTVRPLEMAQRICGVLGATS